MEQAEQTVPVEQQGAVSVQVATPWMDDIIAVAHWLEMVAARYLVPHIDVRYPPVAVEVLP